MVGMKRPYPFVAEDAPGPFFKNKHPPAYASLFPGKDEPALCNNDGTTESELDGNFLTLAPNQVDKFQDTAASEPVKWSEQGRSMQQPFYNFLPAASAVNDLPAGTANSNGKQEEAIDLNLKL